MWHLMICKKKMPSTPSKNKLPGKLFWIKSCTYWIQLQFGEKSSHMAEKNKAVCKICKVPPIFTYIWIFGFGFGIRPKARCFSGQIFGFGLKWKTYLRSFTVQGSKLFQRFLLAWGYNFKGSLLAATFYYIFPFLQLM